MNELVNNLKEDLEDLDKEKEINKKNRDFGKLAIEKTYRSLLKVNIGIDNAVLVKRIKYI